MTMTDDELAPHQYVIGSVEVCGTITMIEARSPYHPLPCWNGEWKTETIAVRAIDQIAAKREKAPAISNHFLPAIFEPLPLPTRLRSSSVLRPSSIQQ